MIRASQGMLAGITRKMSSFIFGSSPAQASGAVSFKDRLFFSFFCLHLYHNLCISILQFLTL